MNFASLHFWFALVIGFFTLSLLKWAGVFGKTGKWGDAWAFVILSLFLLGVESLETMLIFGWVAMVGYFGLNCRKKRQLWCVGGLMLAPLAYYKYSGFLAEILSGERPLEQGLIPMGISFYSFQILSFVIDSFREQKEKPEFVDFLNFASFFPQIVAGPIERRSDLLPQVRNLKFRLRRGAVEDGLPWVVFGLFLKLALAENFALLGGELRPVALNAVQVWLEAVFFGFRIYFDFAGYSFIALGLARCFGIRLTLNFRSPYLARNLQDFWRQWHVTLSRWFRDYVYIPLGGSRGKWVGLNLLIVFVVSGLWHGAGWNFLIWGGLHGLGLWVCFLMKGLRLPAFASWVGTMIFVFLSWLFFMESDWQVAWVKAGMIGTPDSYQFTSAALLGVFEGPKSAILAVLMMVLAVLVMAGEWWSQKRGDLYCIFLNRWIQLALVAGIFFLSPAKESRFIYFNF